MLPKCHLLLRDRPSCWNYLDRWTIGLTKLFVPCVFQKLTLYTYIVLLYFLNTSPIKIQSLHVYWAFNRMRVILTWWRMRNLFTSKFLCGKLDVIIKCVRALHLPAMLESGSSDLLPSQLRSDLLMKRCSKFLFLNVTFLKQMPPLQYSSILMATFAPSDSPWHMEVPSLFCWDLRFQTVAKNYKGSRLFPQ